MKSGTRYYCYVVQVGFKGIRVFKTLKFLCDHLKTKESTMQITNKATKWGYPVSAYSNRAKTRILIYKQLIENKTTHQNAEYLPLDDDIESDFIKSGLDLTKKL